jgi:hypothetical protein
MSSGGRHNQVGGVLEPAWNLPTVFTVIPFQCKKKKDHIAFERYGGKIRTLLSMVF